MTDMQNALFYENAPVPIVTAACAIRVCRLVPMPETAR